MGGAAVAADVLTLLDFYWFHHQILSKHRPPPPPPPPPLHLDFEDTESQTSEPDPTSRLRSPRDELAPSPEDLPIHPPKLQTILSGKQAIVGDEIARAEGSSDSEMRGPWELNARLRRRSRRRRGGSGSRSLSDLEFEELKGFMDLGFTFSDAEADPRLMSIVPGLQRLRASAGDGASATEADAEASPSASDEPSVSRPYLSEAWDAAAAAAAEEEENNLLRSWRLPAAEEGVDMKHHLRLWAHTVASTVR